MSINNCDKCGKEVHKKNSAMWLEVQATGNASLLLKKQDRHLYPYGDCEGSPSRVRLISRDLKWAQAYETLQQQAE
jgi:hypothetical protein